MKKPRVAAGLLLASVLASLVTAAPVRTPPPPTTLPDVSRFDQMLIAVGAIRQDNRQMEDAAADANRALVKTDAAWRDAYNDAQAASKAEIDDLKRKLRKYDHWYVRAVIILANWIKVAIAAYFVACLIIIATSFMNPARPLFAFGRWLFSNLLFVGWTQWFTHRAALPANFQPVAK